MTPGFGTAVGPPLHPGIFAGAAIIFFVYLGFEEIANLAEEAKQPARDIPRSIFLSLGITTLLYVLVGLCVVTLVTPDTLTGSESPLATAVNETSPTLANGLGIIALFATANTVLTTLIVGSRMLFSMARDGDMPPVFERLLPKRQTPWAAALVMLVAAGVFLPFGEIAVVASLSSFVSLVAFTAVNLILVVLRYRVPLSIGRLPILPLLGAISAAALVFQFERRVYLVGVGVVLIGIVVYFGWRFWSKESR